jgi:hypothetical protein
MEKRIGLVELRMLSRQGTTVVRELATELLAARKVVEAARLAADFIERDVHREIAVWNDAIAAYDDAVAVQHEPMGGC